MENIIFETKMLSYSYEQKKCMLSLNNISMKIHKGVKTVILGQNGSGKSTLLYHFNGVFKPISGRMLYKGAPIKYTKEALTALRSEVSMVVQNPNQYIFSATVEEDVAFGPMNIGLDHDEIEKRISDSLFKVGMGKYRDRPSTQLSYGQRKRVSIAGALAICPCVLILDEPTAGLDPQMTFELMELIDCLCCSGTTVIISTHDVDLAYSWADEIHVLRRGELVYSGITETFFSNYNQVIMSGLAIPSVFSINSLIERIYGKSSFPYPHKNSQLLSKLTTGLIKLGKIRLICTENKHTKTISEILNDEVTTGVYGSKTKMIFDENNLHADYNFNAIERCIIDALCGRDTVLFCDLNIYKYVLEQIQSLKLFGNCLRVL